ncbi:MAG TPA: hypothetical protein VK479_01330 [Micropepsaceae bacterium]|jgi:hypothetical protein|nr:hypothetical protein [Micropepsaceae bacterium]
MNGANEADIREEIAAPFLSALGYRRGTENDILREISIAYERVFLGRKKKNDPPLRGRADYVLSVTGVARWVLEIKAPSELITHDTIEQAISYARHPAVSGTYAAVLNGVRIVVFHNSQRPNDVPIVDIEVSTPEELASKLSALLSPSAIRRDCSAPKVDLGQPLIDGFRSTAQVNNGVISYSEFNWECNFSIPDAQHTHLDEMCRMMRGFRSNIIGGLIWRDDSSRIKAKLNWALPHDELLKFAQDKKLMDAEYVSLTSVISSDVKRPTVFDVVGDVSVVKGETLFDILRWDTIVAGIAMAMSYRGQALGHIENGIFGGEFQVEYEAIFPALPGFSLGMFGLGEFQVALDRK